jgi:hypothetical protein
VTAAQGPHLVQQGRAAQHLLVVVIVVVGGDGLGVGRVYRWYVLAAAVEQVIQQCQFAGAASVAACWLGSATQPHVSHTHAWEGDCHTVSQTQRMPPFVASAVGVGVAAEPLVSLSTP